MDGVIVDFVNGWINSYEEKTGVKLEYPDEFLLERNYSGLAGFKPELVNEIMLEKDFFLNLDPMPGAINALRILEKMPGVEAKICTAPKKGSIHCLGEKWEWTDYHLGKFWTDRFIGAYDKTLIYGDILLDDEPYKEGIVEPDWLHILYDHPYNRDIDKLRVTWENWPQLFLDYSQQLEK